MSVPQRLRLSLDRLPRRGELLTLPKAPADFEMRVIYPYNEVGQIKVSIQGAPFYANAVDLINAGATYKNRWTMSPQDEEDGQAIGMITGSSVLGAEAVAA